MATTTNYGWTTPDDTALVKDGASAIRTLGSSVDTTVKNLNPETTLGDLAYRSSTANVKTRLGLGTAGQLLAVNSGATAPEWVNAPSSGGMTLITTTTFNNSASTYTYSSLGSYKHLMIVIDDMTRNNASSVDNLVMRFNGVTSGAPYNSHAFGTADETFTAQSGFNAANYMLLGFRAIANNTVGSGDRGQVAAWIYDYAGSTKKTFTSIARALATTHYATTNIGMWDSTSAITSVTIFTASGNNFNTGTLKLYGVS